MKERTKYVKIYSSDIEQEPDVQKMAIHVIETAACCQCCQ